MSTLEFWQQKAAALNFEGRAWIGDGYSTAEQGRTLPCINPANGDKLTDIADCSEADVDRAVGLARAAFKRGDWSQRTPAERRAVLERFADLVAEHTEELALLETLDMGKPIGDSLAFDLPQTEHCLRFYAGALETQTDEILPTGKNVLATVTREPVGVVAAVVPWNFPLMITCWKLAPALACGNSVIVKPAEQSSLSAIRLAALAAEAGIPAGVFQVLPGQGRITGQALGLHMDIDCLTFTGSTLTGKRFMAYAAQSNLKRVWLECGGKSPQIVFADSQQLERAAACAAAAIFVNQGEVCIAASRLYVEDAIYDEFVQLLLEQARQYQPGAPLDPASRAGAMVDQLQFDRVVSGVKDAVAAGARTLTDTALIGTQGAGWYLNPTILECDDNSNPVMREELFGPVLGVCRFHSEEEVVALANDSDYGLGAGLWTDNLGRAHRVSHQLQAGMVWVNSYADGDITVPFGGRKQSGFGRDKSIHAMDKYSDLKSTWIDLSH
ncbi:aldehyde dehydrogenase [Marinobacterium rhizophilum]|uniref:Aldehyde dehydrogenase n=1 Tax=Marinobacterium rhizophilum TaxID=420402 RepID=A0ABY5HI39_9GAMM|nr:aldehyde dehydrogenase [Marinobacterium rhizophilum]UTW12030.1 aldehyde dehydrogenase [Marinobacterium rhizophilum]